MLKFVHKKNIIFVSEMSISNVRDSTFRNFRRDFFAWKFGDLTALSFFAISVFFLVSIQTFSEVMLFFSSHFCNVDVLFLSLGVILLRFNDLQVPLLCYELFEERSPRYHLVALQHVGPIVSTWVSA